MTAYVYHTATLSLGVLSIEISSVNRKYLDVSVNLPFELSRLDIDLRKAVAAKTSRGNISLRVGLKMNKEAPFKVKPNLPLVRQFVEAWTSIGEEVGLSEKQTFDLTLLKGENGILQYENTLIDDEEFCSEVMAAVNEALDEFVTMKQKEGHALMLDIADRLNKLNTAAEKIKSKEHDATERFRKKLIERLEEVLPGAVENEERILREVCVYAEKVDITEELTRLASHIAQFQKAMDAAEGAIGKKLEFLSQEMLREVNTIGSKSSDIDVSHLTLEMKGELEKIREQLQNIE